MKQTYDNIKRADTKLTYINNDECKEFNNANKIKENENVDLLIDR